MLFLVSILTLFRIKNRHRSDKTMFKRRVNNEKLVLYLTGDTIVFHQMIHDIVKQLFMDNERMMFAI
jgi:hypothetical protein